MELEEKTEVKRWPLWLRRMIRGWVLIGGTLLIFWLTGDMDEWSRAVSAGTTPASKFSVPWFYLPTFLYGGWLATGGALSALSKDER